MTMFVYFSTSFFSSLRSFQVFPYAFNNMSSSTNFSWSLNVRSPLHGNNNTTTMIQQHVLQHQLLMVTQTVLPSTRQQQYNNNDTTTCPPAPTSRGHSMCAPLYTATTIQQQWYNTMSSSTNFSWSLKLCSPLHGNNNTTTMIQQHVLKHQLLVVTQCALPSTRQQQYNNNDTTPCPPAPTSHGHSNCAPLYTATTIQQQWYNMSSSTNFSWSLNVCSPLHGNNNTTTMTQQHVLQHQLLMVTQCVLPSTRQQQYNNNDTTTCPPAPTSHGHSKCAPLYMAIT